ncbi:MAG: hypothetical protein IIW38_01060 [Alistipes sp.]|nr:hypothetical protein [Alistipes sp.]
MAQYQLKEVKTAKEAKAWLHMDRKIYEGNRNWVCPLDSDIEKVFDPKQNELFVDGEAIRWVVVDADGEVVGRIAAFYNREQLAVNQNVGGCGFFESIDSQEVANMLFDAARLWLSSRGAEGMDGPVNFGSRDAWWGLLVQGYEFQPLYTNPYHLPYYKDLFENYGFQNYFNQNTYIWRVYDDSVNDIALEKAKRVMSNPGYRFEDVHNVELDVAAENLRIIYNKAWSLFTGVKPMEKEEAQEMLNSLKPIIDRNIIFFAYFNDEPIGFFVMVPDINRVIGKYKGNFNLVNKLRLLWDINVRKASDRIFAIIFGITPEFQGKGIESGMIKHILETYIKSDKCHYKTIEFAWIGDFNPVMNRMIERYVCATKHKMHTTYRYWFDRTRPFERCPRLGLRRPDKQ